MNQLVFLENDRVLTDSLLIAQIFDKEHKNVLRDIENLECSPEFNKLNFERISYQDSMNRTKPKYLITQDGFSFLVMGYTGKEAARFKEMYINEFNRMKQTLNDPFANLSPELKAILTVDRKVTTLEHKIVEVEQKVEQQITLTQGEQRNLQKVISTKVYSLAHDSQHRAELYRELYREIKDRWGVPSYRDVLRKDLPNVKRYVEAWQPKVVV